MSTLLYMNTESGIFGSIFSKDIMESIVGAIEKPMINAKTRGYTDGCTGGIQSCTSSNCYSCGCK